MKLLLSIFLLLLFSCSSINNNSLSLGSKLSEEILKTPSHLVLIAPAQFNKAYYIKKKGVLYSVSVDDESKEIIYVLVTDPLFVTKERLKVGMKLSEIKKRVFSYSYKKDYLGGIVVPLKDAWKAHLLLEEDEYVIKSFFKKAY